VVDVQEAIGDHCHAPVRAHYRFHVYLDIALVVLRSQLATILPCRLSKVVRESGLTDTRGESILHTQEFKRLVHRLDAK